VKRALSIVTKEMAATRLVGATVTAALTVVLGLVVPIDPSGATASSTDATVKAFVASAKHALTGTFTEVYRVIGPSSGTVTLYQQAPAGVNPVPMGRGRWAFMYQATTAISSQWIEKGAAAWDCWRPATETVSWTCSGPGHFEEVNGFILATRPYIPSVVGGDINALETGLKVRAPQVRVIEVSRATSPQFGPIRCLHVDSITSCIDQSGTLVSQNGGSYWTNITLLKRSATVPSSAFRLVGRSTSAGKKFIVVPT